MIRWLLESKSALSTRLADRMRRAVKIGANAEGDTLVSFADSTALEISCCQVAKPNRRDAIALAVCEACPKEDSSCKTIAVPLRHFTPDPLGDGS